MPDPISELTVSTKSFLCFSAASVSLGITTVSLPEGDAGEMTRVEVCVILDDIQGGLLRELTYTLTVNFGTAGTKQQCYSVYSFRL